MVSEYLTQRSSPANFNEQIRHHLFVIAPDFPPETLPTANRTAKLLKHLKKSWNIQVLTGTPNGALEEIPVQFARSWSPDLLLHWLKKLKFEKFIDWLIYPDDRIFWLIPALIKGLALIKRQKPDCIVVFMMPYSAGLVGVVLKWFTKLPLVLNLDDSPTCVDMHSSFPSWLHYQFTRRLEDFYIQHADAVIYVSQVTLETVKARQPHDRHSKLKLVRYGADPQDFMTDSPVASPCQSLFEIAYIGGMTGWYEFYHSPVKKSAFKKFYQRWLRFGRYEQSQVYHGSSSPMFIGAAVQEVLRQNPSWSGKIRITIYGNRFLERVVQQALSTQNLSDLVSVFGTISNWDAVQAMKRADLLFMALPDRLHPRSGGRISAKTYEYLMSDRPILAAVPAGENWNYLAGKPGVWLVKPTDVEAMAATVSQLAALKFSGQDLKYDRTDLHHQLSYAALAESFSQVLAEVIMPVNLQC